MCEVSRSEMKRETQHLNRSVTARPAPQEFLTDIPQMNAGSRRNLPGFVISDKAVGAVASLRPLWEQRQRLGQQHSWGSNTNDREVCLTRAIPKRAMM